MEILRCGVQTKGHHSLNGTYNWEKSMPDVEVLKIKNIVDITDQLKQKDRRMELFKTIRQSIDNFNDAYRVRRERLLEINAIYRNKSYLDKNKGNWQTKMFLPLPYNAVERKTSMIHQALWGNRIGSPFTAVGRTPEDHSFSQSAEGTLNNTVDRIGFYGVSEEGIRSVCKYGLGAYRYGWVRRTDEVLWREVERDEKGQVKRDKDKQPFYRYVRKKIKINQPFIRAIDVVDHLGWEPSAKQFEKWSCGYVFEIEEKTKEEIYEIEKIGNFEVGSFDRLKQRDPHGFNEVFDTSKKEPQIRRDEGLEQSPFIPLEDKYQIVNWWGWFDIDGDGLREFIKASVILKNSLILNAEENLLGEYPIVDIQYSRSLHSLTPWGVVDPVVEMSYQINELFNQRGDSIKLKLNPQFLINADKVFEDHAYVSSPGAFHPFRTEDEPVTNAMAPLQFQNLEYLSTNEEERLMNLWSESVGVADFQKILNTTNKNTPATTIISILNEQQAGNSMIVNGILDRHGELGSRILKMLQLFGDEQFILRVGGRRGLEFRKESLENILGQFDIKVTTSTFFGNKEIELQQLIQLRPFWAESEHIDIVEVDKSILENILPKKVEKILRVSADPLSIIDEQILFVAGQGESVKLSPKEDIPSLQQKFRAHQSFKSSKIYTKLDGQTKEEFNIHLDRIQARIQEIQIQQQLQAQEAAHIQQQLIQGGVGGLGGNLTNVGSPNVRTVGNAIRPQPNNVPNV